MAELGQYGREAAFDRMAGLCMMRGLLGRGMGDEELANLMTAMAEHPPRVSAYGTSADNLFVAQQHVFRKTHQFDRDFCYKRKDGKFHQHTDLTRDKLRDWITRALSQRDWEHNDQMAAMKAANRAAAVAAAAAVAVASPSAGAAGYGYNATLSPWRSYASAEDADDDDFATLQYDWGLSDGCSSSFGGSSSSSSGGSSSSSSGGWQ